MAFQNAKIKIVISAEDKTSGAFSKTSRNAKKLNKDLNSQIKRIGERFSEMGRKFTTRVSLPIAAGFGLAFKSAVEFEDTFAGIRKTVDASEAEFSALSNNIRDIARRTPVATSELNRIGELAGQLGVRGVDNLTKFINTIAEIAVTTNLTEEQAATSFARIANIMQEPITNVDRMGSAVVDLGNNFATTESEIVDFANRIAGAGQVAGLTTSDIFGIATAFSSVGVQAERGGTAVSKTIFAMTNAVKSGGDELQQFADIAGVTADQFVQVFEKDAVAAFDLFVQGLGKSGIKATGLLEELELADQRLMQSFISVAGAGGTMSKAIDTASEAFDENNALTEEAQKRFRTTASRLKIARNNFNDLAITIGTDLIPAVIPLVQKIVDLIEKFQNADQSTKDWIKRIAFTAAVIGPALIVVGKLVTAIGAISGVAASAAAAVAGSGGLAASLGFLANPIGATILGLGLVAGAGFLVAKAIKTSTEETNTAFETYNKFTEANNRLKEAQKRVKESTDDVKEAQRIYNEKVKNFGPDSKEAKKAMKKLEKAQFDHALAIEKAEIQQQFFNKAEENFVKSTPGVEEAIQKRAIKLGLIVNQLGTGIKTAEDLDNAIRNIKPKSVPIRVFTEGFDSGGLQINQVGGQQHGTAAFRGGVTTVGETGPELVHLPAGSRVTSVNNTPPQAGQSNTINITVQAGAFMGNRMEARKFAEFIKENLKDVARSKNMSMEQMMGNR